MHRLSCHEIRPPSKSSGTFLIYPKPLMGKNGTRVAVSDSSGVSPLSGFKLVVIVAALVRRSPAPLGKKGNWDWLWNISFIFRLCVISHCMKVLDNNLQLDYDCITWSNLGWKSEEISIHVMWEGARFGQACNVGFWFSRHHQKFWRWCGVFLFYFILVVFFVLRVVDA